MDWEGRAAPRRSTLGTVDAGRAIGVESARPWPAPTLTASSLETLGELLGPQQSVHVAPVVDDIT
jgi:hypothetical protein